MSETKSILVRGRCACGRRYRIRNAVVGVSVECPNCRRPITVTDADILAASGSDRFIPVQDARIEPLEAIVIDHGELQLAPEGSKPGLTGETVFGSNDALMFNAMRGWSMPHESDSGARHDSEIESKWFGRVKHVKRSFGHDLLASFYFAGMRRNVINVLLTAMAFSVFTVVLYIPSLLALPFGIFAILLRVICGIAMLLVFGFATQFYWSVMRLTVEGEDEIPWVDSDWSFWADGLRPALWLILITSLCAGPAYAVGWWVPQGFAGQAVVFWGLVLVGSLLWPIAVMSVGVGDSLGYLRPDLLVRGIAAIGPAYLAGWALALLTVVAWRFSWQALWRVPELSRALLLVAPLATFFLNLYFGYVLFRTLGLLHRHFGARLRREFDG